MKTIRKNSTKKITAIFEKAAAFKYYTLSNGFTGEIVEGSASHNERIMKDIKSGMAKLKANESETSFDITYHSNLWIEFTIN